MLGWKTKWSRKSKEKRQLSQAEAGTQLGNYNYTDSEWETAKIPAEFAVSNVKIENQQATHTWVACYLYYPHFLN